MPIDLFPTSSNLQSTKHYSSIARGKKVIYIQPLTEAEEFCTCVQQCIPSLKMFTDEIGVDPIKNDFYSLFQNPLISNTFEVYIVVNGVQSAVITTSIYGQLHAYANCYGYRFDAFKIYQAFGFCEWYGILLNKDTLGNIVQEERTPVFNLQKYTEKSANRTIRIETKQKGKLLHGKDYSNFFPLVPGNKTIDFWPQQIRLPGALLLTGIPVENDGVIMNDSIRSRRQVVDRLTLEYDLEIDLVSSEQVFDNVILDYLFSGPVFVTDYNVYSWKWYKVPIRLVRTGHSLNPRVAKRKSIVVKMQREEENIEKYSDVI